MTPESGKRDALNENASRAQVNAAGQEAERRIGCREIMSVLDHGDPLMMSEPVRATNYHHPIILR